ncbi:family 14 glycosylhydrolase [[Brevibacterium] frigoritolerans]|uniref:Family 14 glycosylhydrolase n=1 Tax=Peribacillus frigoritolerans TaxID=450367 RepID=A0A941FPW6_9BACI|nr:family 14 glycosylhydrolase [Peribacillus frigoritolerans]
MKASSLKWVPILSTHQCGGNVGMIATTPSRVGSGIKTLPKTWLSRVKVVSGIRKYLLLGGKAQPVSTMNCTNPLQRTLLIRRI